MDAFHDAARHPDPVGTRALGARRLALRYALFAAAATAANLAFQYVALRLYEGSHALAAAIGAGTLAGLIVKYVLDKRWIFFYRTRGLADDTGRFIRYTVSGVLTTLVFWGTEVLFHWLIPLDWAKYAGAVVGLSIGYVLKYRLDRRYVFTGSAACA